MNGRLARMTEGARQLQQQVTDGSLVRGVLRQHEQDIMEQQHIQLLSTLLHGRLAASRIFQVTGNSV